MPLLSYLGGLDRFFPCRLGSHMSRLRHLGWNQFSHDLTSRPLESCHHQRLKAVSEVLGYPKGSASELLDGTLKLRYCTTIFTTRFSPWSSPRVANGGGKRQFGTPGHHSDPGGNLEKRVRLTKEARPGISSHVNPDPGHPTSRRWKRLRSPFFRRRGEVRWACLAIFFLALGLGDFCAWGRLEPAFGGNRRRGTGWTVQSMRLAHWC